MPEIVVDILEIVDVDKDDREGAAGAVAALELRRQRLAEATRVAEPGEWIGHRLLLDLRLEGGEIAVGDGE